MSEVTWDKLSQVAVKGAEYNSRERHPHPKCLEGTRVALLNYIYELLDKKENNQIIWLHGTAGVGKSAVAFTVAERMKGLKVTEQTRVETRLAGTFFFSRKHTNRRTTGYFFATLAYQLATNFPSVKTHVNRAILDNPALLDPDKSLRDQMEGLFLRPLRNLRYRLDECGGPPLAFIIDALDECISETLDEDKSASELAELISLLAQALSDPELPVTHILITSRLEGHIRGIMQNEHVRPLVGEIPVNISGEGVALTISLDGADVDEDIYRFLENSFRQLQLRYSTFLQPTKAQLARLASRAGRRFIVATTMMKFIDDQRNHPRDQLELMLNLTSQLLPGTEVYKLYDLILSTCTDPKLAYMYLSIVVVLADPLPISQISELLDLPPGRDVKDVLVQLRSVIDLPADSSLPVNIYHSSVRDYVSCRSNCSLPEIQSITSPHSLLAYSSLYLMVREIPASTVLLDALSEFKKYNQAMQPIGPLDLEDLLSNMDERMEPLEVLIASLWLRGNYHPELQFWLDSPNGRAYLQSERVMDWLQTQGGQDWLQTDAGKRWLKNWRAREWLGTNVGRDWLQTEAGKDWLQTDGQKDWLWTRVGQDWLQTDAGRDWLQADGKKSWLTTKAGRDWLQTAAGQDLLETKAGQDWLETEAGRDWQQADGKKWWVTTKTGQDWLRTEAGKDWLQTNGQKDWLWTQAGQDWLETDAGRDWLQADGKKWWLMTKAGRDWLRTEVGQDWLRTEAGKDWLQTNGQKYWLWTQVGQDWLQTDAGRDWLQADGKKSWLTTKTGQDWLRTEAGKDWLWTRVGQDWLQTQAGRDWLETDAGRDWLQADGKKSWLTTKAGRDWLQTAAGQDLLETKAGQDWLETEAGRDWQQADGKKWWLTTKTGQDWLRTETGKDWLWTWVGQDWLQTQAGRDWLQTQAGRDWSQTSRSSTKLSPPQYLQKQGVPDWLTTKSGQDWLWFEDGRDWLQTQAAHDWLRKEVGQDWLATESGHEWLQTQDARDWLRKQGGQNWLATYSAQWWLESDGGQDWLQKQDGRDWLQTPCGREWRLTTIWVTMKEFSSTSKAIREYIISPELSLHPAFQAIQHFYALPDDLMFPVFLALRQQDHFTTTSPDMEIIHAMKALSSFADETREQSQSTSSALNYACQNWVVHLSRTPKPWDQRLAHMFQSFWNHNLLSWLGRQWCLKDLPSCLTILSEGEKLAKEHLLHPGLP